jgi:serine/threonine protein kinase
MSSSPSPLGTFEIVHNPHPDESYSLTYTVTTILSCTPYAHVCSGTDDSGHKLIFKCKPYIPSLTNPDTLTSHYSFERSLSHPNIISPLNSFWIPGFFVVVYDFASHGTLLTRNGLWPLSQVCAVISQLLDSLNYLHNHGYIHCDVKLENIFIPEIGADGIPKIWLADLDSVLEIEQGSFRSKGIWNEN